MASKTKQYDIQTTTYKTAGTASAYTLTIPKLDALYDELTFVVEFHVENDASATLNINSLGAIAIKTSEGNDIEAGDLKTTGRYALVYDQDSGTIVVSQMVDSEVEMIDSIIAGTDYTAASMVTARTTTSLTYVKVKSATITKSGTYTITRGFRGNGGGYGYSRIYKNGVAIGPEHSARWGGAYEYPSEDYAVSAGDTLEIRYHMDSNCSDCRLLDASIKYNLANEHITCGDILD